METHGFTSLMLIQLLHNDITFFSKTSRINWSFLCTSSQSTLKTKGVKALTSVLNLWHICMQSCMIGCWYNRWNGTASVSSAPSSKNTPAKRSCGEKMTWWRVDTDRIVHQTFVFLQQLTALFKQTLINHLARHMRGLGRRRAIYRARDTVT